MSTQYIQDLMMIVFGFVGIVILLFVLRHVHAQARKVQELKKQLELNQSIEDAEVSNQQQNN